MDFFVNGTIVRPRSSSCSEKPGRPSAANDGRAGIVECSVAIADMRRRVPSQPRRRTVYDTRLKLLVIRRSGFRSACSFGFFLKGATGRYRQQILSLAIGIGGSCPLSSWRAWMGLDLGHREEGSGSIVESVESSTYSNRAALTQCSSKWCGTCTEQPVRYWVHGGM